MTDGDTSTDDPPVESVLGTTSAPGGFPDDHRDARLVGVTSDGAPLYYDPDEHRRFEAAPDADPETGFEWVTSEYLDGDATVADLVAAIEDGIGWRRLSAYGRERVPDDVAVDTRE